MSTLPVADVTIDLNNLQGIIHHFYRRKVWRHLLFHFGSPAAGRAFVKALIPCITVASAGDSPPNDQLLNVGITATGLAALGVNAGVVDQFPLEFQDPPDPVVMGDSDKSSPDNESAPEKWWHAKFKTPEIHAIVHLFCSPKPAMEDWTKEVRAKADGTRRQGIDSNGRWPTNYRRFDG